MIRKNGYALRHFLNVGITEQYAIAKPPSQLIFLKILTLDKLGEGTRPTAKCWESSFFSGKQIVFKRES